jgi:Protein of unknown function (DUF2924)
VTVLADGVLLRGARYRSLAEVARKITGTRWSGPRFFRLRAPITLSARPAECAESEGGKLFTLQEKQK